ncbi:MAG: M28 family peptidase [Candidatus Dormibacteria bacterium]
MAPCWSSRRAGNFSPGSDALRRDVEYLAALHRPSASPGERTAALWIADALRDSGCTVSVEEERAHGTMWWPVGLMTAAATAAGLISLRRSRFLGGLLGACAALTIADDIDSGRRRLRRALPQSSTWNVVAETGDIGASRTLVIMAHHDAAHTGLLFDQRLQRWVWEKHPGWLDRLHSSAPFWFPVVGGPALVAVGSALRLRALVRVGTVLSAACTAALADIGLRETVPGANDNISAVAVQLELARVLRRTPVTGLRVLLLSAGSEEALQEGILAFARRHFDELPRDSTYFFNLDTVASPHLLMPEGEGVLRMRDYDGAMKAAVVAAAEDAGVPLQRGLRARVSTDAVVPMKAGYPAALLSSLTDWKALANYHLPTDTAANLDYDTLAGAARLTEALVRRMAAGG